MKMIIECSDCEKTVEADVSGILRTVIECAENKSIYGGLLCENCALKLDEEY